MHNYARFFGALAMVTVFVAGKGVVAAEDGDLASDSGVPFSLHLEQPWQTGPFCGTNTLYCLLRMHDIPVSRDELQQHLSPPDQGNSIEELRQAAAQWGLKTEVVKIAPRDMENLKFPLIAHLRTHGDEDHFVLVYGIATDDTVKTIDGTTIMAVDVHREIFFRAFTGYALVTEFRMYWILRILQTVLWGEIGVLALLVVWWLLRMYVGRRSAVGA